MITIFTPTYNRAHTLPRLYESLRQQTDCDFEWLVINDGSTDNTKHLFAQWMKEENKFPIEYHETSNGGKQRAINEAMHIARGEYFFIVDSDDYLLPEATLFIKKAFERLPKGDSFIGISGIKGGLDGKPLFHNENKIPEGDYIDANNLEREKYGLQADMAEVFFTDKLKRYTFPVWEGETFTPEAVVWDKMALDGYKIRWFDKVIYLCEYQADGLTNSSWKLLKRNPMGYAMLFNTQLKYKEGWKDKINLVLQFISCCCLAKEYGYMNSCTHKLLAYLLFPIGWALSVRRNMQFKKYDV